ncbi:MAG TPA: AbrB/MazE/SpoVT family DNA-binding domain-containing protein [Candidatus Binataceae bacterium]|nr:AbrB/MazE/SpoVT family DNA-binding domain-containing protein [Candidatus Binataceae bacterium]
MHAKVAKWGNSLGVRIPKTAAQQIGLNEGADVDVTVSGKRLVLAPTRRKYSLNELVNGITAKNRHAESDWGKPAGKEIW